MSYKRFTVSCVNCKVELASTQLDRHFKSKQCLSGGKFSTSYGHCTSNCPYCQLDISTLSASLRANHARWCNLNPSRNQTKNHLNNAEQLNTKESIAKRAKSISKAHSEGRYHGAPKKSVETRMRNGTLKHTNETKVRMSISASKCTHQRTSKKTQIFIDIKGRETKMDSSWEISLAKRLDDLEINWIRPAPLQYWDGVRHRNYFGDFYLPEHDLYIDPKNPYVEKCQIKKLCIIKMRFNLIILRTLKECEDFEIDWGDGRGSNPH